MNRGSLWQGIQRPRGFQGTGLLDVWRPWSGAFWGWPEPRPLVAGGQDQNGPFWLLPAGILSAPVLSLYGPHVAMTH